MNLQQSVHKNQSLTLSDDRRLGYAEYGMPNGSPVLFFHGAPGSSSLSADMLEIATRCNIRLIAVDRPGYGLSNPHAGRTFLSWADDIAVLMDRLGIKHFSIIGFSGGSPYALACVYKLSDRVQKIALVGSLAPLDEPGIMECLDPIVSGIYSLAQSNPDELRATFASIAPSTETLLVNLSTLTGEWDKKVLLERATEFSLEYAQMLLNGTEGVASDYILFSGNWAFPIAGIKTEVHLWSGTLDQNTPPAMTHYLASQLANSHTHVLKNEGHFVLYGHWDDILKSVV